MEYSSRKESKGYSPFFLIAGYIILLLVAAMACNVLASAPPTTTVVLPPFPWPPPKPSAIVSLQLGVLGENAGKGLTFHQVDAKISQALISQGYDEISYYGVPNGFAIVTRLEQIAADGSSIDSAYRWAPSLAPVSLKHFSLSNYLEALFGVPKGHYRIFVFIITSDTVTPSGSGTPVSQGEASTWFLEGADRLPSAMGALPYTGEHRTTVYIYEFVQSGMGEKANLNLPSSISGRKHLEGAGLWDILEE